jgi:hypothetical protein
MRLGSREYRRSLASREVRLEKFVISYFSLKI